MIRVLKRVLISIVLTAGLPMAVCQNTVSSPPAMRLPRGCVYYYSVYYYQPPIILKVPNEFAGKYEQRYGILSSAQLSFQGAAATPEKGSAPGPFWPAFKLAEDTSHWTVLCGLHGLNDRESTE